MLYQRFYHQNEDPEKSRSFHEVSRIDYLKRRIVEQVRTKGEFYRIHNSAETFCFRDLRSIVCNQKQDQIGGLRCFKSNLLASAQEKVQSTIIDFNSSPCYAPEATELLEVQLVEIRDTFTAGTLQKIGSTSSPDAQNKTQSRSSRSSHG